MIHHQAKTPYFLQIPQEFIEFIDNGYPGSEQDFPFLRELAHYEWIELELSVSTAENDVKNIATDGDLLDDIPVKSKMAYVLAYDFPVHNISAEFLPETPGEQPTILAVYRRADDSLGFMELNPVTARLLQLIDDNQSNRTGRQLLADLAGEMNYADIEGLTAHGVQAMQQMLQAEILIGTKNSAG